MRERIRSCDYDLVILDEVCIALHYKLFPVEEVLDMADLITEVKEVKHYYHDGVEAREGIEF